MSNKLSLNKIQTRTLSKVALASCLVVGNFSSVASQESISWSKWACIGIGSYLSTHIPYFKNLEKPKKKQIKNEVVDLKVGDVGKWYKLEQKRVTSNEVYSYMDPKTKKQVCDFILRKSYTAMQVAVPVMLVSSIPTTQAGNPASCSACILLYCGPMFPNTAAFLTCAGQKMSRECSWACT